MAAAPSIIGTAGDDNLAGTSGDEQIFGLAGNDMIFGGGGLDTIDAGSGADVISVGAGADVTTGAGQDTVRPGFSSITIEDFTPGPGGDLLAIDNGLYLAHVNLPSFSDGNVWLSQVGADTVLNINSIFAGTYITSPAQIIFKNTDAGALTADNIGSFNTPTNQYIHPDNPQTGSYRGTAGADVLVSAAGANNHLMGGDGNDTTFGNTGNDTHTGGAGNDVLVDVGGADSLSGEDGNDTIWGGDGPDTLNGGAGNDYLIGQGGDDAITGGAGADTFFVNPGDGNTWVYDFNSAEGDRFVIPAGMGVQIYQTGIGNGVDVVVATLSNGQIINLQGASTGTLGDWIVGSPDETMFGGNTNNETLTGGNGNDVIVDGPGSAVINGGAGNDTLWGGDWTDFLYGGAGNDRLIGQGGTNLLTGGAGADQFVVTTADTSDWIADFNKAEGDKVLLPGGAAFTMAQFDGFVAVGLSTGQQIGIQGATVASLGTDWFTFY